MKEKKSVKYTLNKLNKLEIFKINNIIPTNNEISGQLPVNCYSYSLRV